jgi:hypothetical protein
MKSKKISEAGSYSRGFAGTGGRRDREDDEGYTRTRPANDAHNRAVSRTEPAAQPAVGQFFIRIDGKVWRKNGTPVSFDTKEHANAVGRKIREKIPGKAIMLTTNPADKMPAQGMGEEAVGTIVPSAQPGKISVEDPATKVTTSVPANSPMLGKDAAGKLVLHTTPTTGSTPGGQPATPELPKPGEKVQIASEENEAVNRISAGGHTHGDELADTNVESPIGGDEARDNLMTRMKKLAGL